MGRVWRRLWLSAALAAALSAWAPGVSTAAKAPAVDGAVSDSVTMSGTLAVAVSGHYAYTTAYYSGRLVAVDISHPAHPVIAGASPYSSSLQDASTVNIVGPYAYVVSKNRNAGKTTNDDGTGNSLTILDIASDPRHPAIVATLHDPTNLFGAYGVAAGPRFVYVAAQGVLHGQPTQPDTSTGAFSVIDAGNPAAPAIVATLQNSALPAPWTGTNVLQHISSVALSGRFAYVTAAYANRLTVIDITNPLSPTIVGSVQDANALDFPVDVAVSGRYAYVVGQASSHPTLTVVDVSRPAAPRVVGSLSSGSLNGAYRIRVRGRFAFVASITASTLSVIDISHPTLPHLDAGVWDHLVHLHSAAGLDLDPTGRYAVVASPSLASQSGSIYPPFPLQPGGPTITGTITTVKLDPARLKAVIVASTGAHRTGSPRRATFYFAASDAVASFQCKLDRGPFRPCTGATHQQYTSLRPGRHVFTVRAIDPAGDSATTQKTWFVGPRHHRG